ncbi:MAG: hypothetical protein AAFY99_14635 [Pseudomonadota bacterium]
MEALILILVELLAAPLIALVTLVANFFIGFLLITLELLAALFGWRWSTYQQWKKRRTSTQPTPAAKPKSRAFRLFEVVALSALLVFLCAALLIELVFFQPTARYVLHQISERTPYQVTAENISGSLFSARIKAENVTVRTKSESPVQLSFDVDSFSADANTFSLLMPFSDPRINVAAAGMDGSVVTPPKTGDEESSPSNKPKRDFVIETLELNDIKTSIALAGSEPIIFEIERMVSEPLRSESALFDLFFRSNMSATIDGAPLEITMVETTDGRITTWQADALPLTILPKITNKAPLGWITEGTVSLDVQDAWSRGEADEIDLDWNIILSGARFEAPDDASLTQRTLALPVVRYVNGRDDDIELGFALTLDENGLQYATSLDALGLWDALVSSVSSAISEKIGVTSDAVESGIDRFIDRTRNLLDRRAREQGESENE